MNFCKNFKCVKNNFNTEHHECFYKNGSKICIKKVKVVYKLFKKN